MRYLDRVPSWLVIVARLALAGLFAWAAVPKVLDPHAFAESISNYRLLPELMVGPLAIFVPLLELSISLSLVTGFHARGAALAATGMLLVFAAAMAQAILRDINIECGCFGSSTAAEVGWPSVLRNVGLALLGALIVLSRDVPWRKRA